MRADWSGGGVSEEPDGTSRYAFEIIADNIQFLTPKPAAAQAAVAA